MAQGFPTLPRRAAHHATALKVLVMSHPAIRRLPLLTLSLLAACESAPLSFLDGRPKTATDPLLYPVRVVSVDGSIQFSNPVQVEPGPRWLVLEAAPSGSARGTTQQTFVMRVEPCTRYYLGARRTSSMEATWQVVIDDQERVAGCDAEAERRKATPRPSSFLVPASGPRG